MLPEKILEESNQFINQASSASSGIEWSAILAGLAGAIGGAAIGAIVQYCFSYRHYRMIEFEAEKKSAINITIKLKMMMDDVANIRSGMIAQIKRAEKSKKEGDIDYISQYIKPIGGIYNKNFDYNRDELYTIYKLKEYKLIEKAHSLIDLVNSIYVCCDDYETEREKAFLNIKVSRFDNGTVSTEMSEEEELKLASHFHVMDNILHSLMNYCEQFTKESRESSDLFFIVFSNYFKDKSFPRVVSQ